MLAEKILNQVQNTYGGTIPTNALAIVESMLTEKTLGNKVFDKMEAEYNVSSGFFFAVKTAITDQRKAENYVSNAAAGREDRILRIRNSDGKATARKF